MGSLNNLPFGAYMVEASVDVWNSNNNCCSDNSMMIECSFSNANDTGHLYLNGDNTNKPYGTLTMITEFPITSGTISYNCQATTGGSGGSGVFVQSVRITALALDNISEQ